MYPCRLIEVDLPGKRVSTHARREKSIRHGHIAEVKTLLGDAGKQLDAVMQDEAIMAETPVEVQSAIESAVRSIGAVLVRLESIASNNAPSAPLPGGPTRQ